MEEEEEEEHTTRRAGHRSRISGFKYNAMTRATSQLAAVGTKLDWRFVFAIEWRIFPVCHSAYTRAHLAHLRIAVDRGDVVVFSVCRCCASLEESSAIRGPSSRPISYRTLLEAD